MSWRLSALNSSDGANFLGRGKRYGDGRAVRKEWRAMILLDFCCSRYVSGARSCRNNSSRLLAPTDFHPRMAGKGKKRIMGEMGRNINYTQNRKSTRRRHTGGRERWGKKGTQFTRDWYFFGPFFSFYYVSSHFCVYGERKSEDARFGGVYVWYNGPGSAAGAR